MKFMNPNTNIKQFQLIKFINENCSDEYVISKITIVLRRDKIEAPFYMITKIKLSTCIDSEETGIIHAMDMLNHNRTYNLTENAYRKIESFIEKTDKDDNVKITKSDNQLKMVLISRNASENRNIFKKYNELFNTIDSMLDQ